LKRTALSLIAFTLCVANAAVPAQASAQRTLRVALTQEPATLNPIVGTLQVETDVQEFIFDGLIRHDDHGNAVPDLAERVPTRENGGISSDGRTITYHLVHNAHWQDGAPVTSQDVKFTFEAIMNPKNNVGSRVPYDEIARVETPDPYTVRLVLKRPWAPVLQEFADGNVGAIVPAHLLSKYSDLNRIDYNAAPIGSGPYRLLSWRRGSEMILEANPNYFRGAPRIKHVVIRFLTNDNTMLIASRTGELDLADRLNISTFVQLGVVPHMVAATNIQSFWEHLTFNTGRPPLSDVEVRRALCYAVDVHNIFEKVAHGIGALGPTEENPETQWFDRHLHYYPYDPKKAAQMLDADGWKLGPDGVRVKDGKRLSLTFVSTSGNITREATEVILQESWRAIGADVTIKNGPASMVFAVAANGGPLYSGNFDVALTAFIIANPDPYTIPFNSEDSIPPNGNNLAFFRNPEVTQLENKAASTFDIHSRKRLYDRIQTIVLRDAPYYTMRWASVTDIRAEDLNGVRPPVTGSTFWNVADWEFR
jgi:peptide/nickel transport system substrate-binding protein